MNHSAGSSAPASTPGDPKDGPFDDAAHLLALWIEAEARRTTREVTRAGRELVRAGATLEALQQGVATIAPALDRLRDSLKSELVREYARERQQREAAESAALDDIVATLDGLERSLEAARELALALLTLDTRRTAQADHAPDVLGGMESLIEGLELNYRRLEDSLARRGVSRIAAAGNPFDPYLHEAVATEPSAPDQDGIVLREERRGYRSAERVIRLAQVVVGRAAAPPQPAFAAGNAEIGGANGAGRAGDNREQREKPKRNWLNWLRKIGLWPTA